MATRYEFDAIEGGLVGLLIGDALGVPYEFRPPDRIPPLEEIEYQPPAGDPPSHSRVPPGTWSDDGAQALCLLESLLLCGKLDLQDFGRRLVRWLEGGHMAVDGLVFDCGVQTGHAIEALKKGVAAESAGPRGERDNGNGSLMRVLPLILWHRGDDRALAEDAARQSRPTHGHRRSQLCCELYCLWGRRILEGSANPWRDAVESLGALHDNDAEAMQEMEGPMALASGFQPGGSGYVVDCLHSARLALEQDSYEGVVRVAIALGNDTDTTAAVAGGLAGLRHGLGGIPVRWREGLRGREIFEPLLRRLHSTLQAGPATRGPS